MPELDHTIMYELSRMAVAPVSPTELSDFISRRIIRSFAAKYHIVWLVKEGLAYPSLYSLDDDLIGNLYTQQLIKTSYNLNDGVWDKLWKGNKPAVIDFAEGIIGKTVPEWVPLLYNQGLKQMLGVPLTNGRHVEGFFCLYGNRLSVPEGPGLSFLHTVALQVFTCIKSRQLNQVMSEQQEEIARLSHSAPLPGGASGAQKHPAIIGSGAAIKDVLRLVALVAPSDTTVLLTGETGTGKEVIARAIHAGSFRKEQPMVRVNCAALPANLIESELFGHEKGSFTGALQRRMGKFELAEGGTIFLDEIGELPLELQTRLLRVLQEKEVERIGGKGSFKVDVRIIAATNRDLRKEMKMGRFRSDLYYRLNVFPIQLPPLHKRKEDIPELVSWFMDLHAKSTGKKIRVPSRVLRSLQDYSWPGNIRELENLIARGILNTKGDILADIHLPTNDITQKAEKTQGFLIRPLAEMEREYILEVIKYCSGKISGPNGAAVKLGIPSTTLISKMHKLGIRKEHFIKKEK
jgi:formate hydrogenlyase transcriptional activator